MKEKMRKILDETEHLAEKAAGLEFGESEDNNSDETADEDDE